MQIYVDTRQKEGKHNTKHNQMEMLGCELIHKKLDVGDYMKVDNDKVTIDTKQDLTEVYGNIINDKSRFMREVKRAFENHIKLIVLIEQGGQIKSFADVSKWNPKYGTVNAKTLQNRMYQIHIAYGVDFLFCDKRVTGRKIIELLSDDK